MDRRRLLLHHNEMKSNLWNGVLLFLPQIIHQNPLAKEQESLAAADDVEMNNPTSWTKGLAKLLFLLEVIVSDCSSLGGAVKDEENSE